MYLIVEKKSSKYLKCTCSLILSLPYSETRKSSSKYQQLLKRIFERIHKHYADKRDDTFLLEIVYQVSKTNL